VAGPRQPSTSRGGTDSAPAIAEVRGSSLETALPAPPPETTELGIDIIRVSRIRDSMARFGDRFTRRVLTPNEMAYVRNRAETMAGRWAAKEAVSKVLGLGIRGIGWRDIEVERLPTGQPAVKLHGRAARRAEQLGMGRIAISISHESDYAVAIASGVRTAGGRFLYPPDIEERLSEREASLMRRFERLRALAKDVAVSEAKLTTGPDGPAGRHPQEGLEEGTDA
jgi:holo-[acyl-carrier protein] synthase